MRRPFARAVLVVVAVVAVVVLWAGPAWSAPDIYVQLPCCLEKSELGEISSRMQAYLKCEAKARQSSVEFPINKDSILYSKEGIDKLGVSCASIQQHRLKLQQNGKALDYQPCRTQVFGRSRPPYSSYGYVATLFGTLWHEGLNDVTFGHSHGLTYAVYHRALDTIVFLYTEDMLSQQMKAAPTQADPQQLADQLVSTCLGLGSVTYTCLEMYNLLCLGTPATVYFLYVDLPTPGRQFQPADMVDIPAFFKTGNLPQGYVMNRDVVGPYKQPGSMSQACQDLQKHAAQVDCDPIDDHCRKGPTFVKDINSCLKYTFSGKAQKALSQRLLNNPQMTGKNGKLENTKH